MTAFRRAAFLVFPRLTLLDVVGPYDALRRVRTMGVDAAFSWRFVGTAPVVTDDSGLGVHIDEVLGAGTLDDFDLLVVPGGHGVDDLRGDARVVAAIRGFADRTIASVCSGSLLLGDAGLLVGRVATTHPSRLVQLAPLCARVDAAARVVDEGQIVTAGGVTSGIDLGLHLVERGWGAAARAKLAAQMVWPVP